MDLIIWIIAFTAAGGVVSVLFASGFLLLPDRARAGVMPLLVSFAIGALLGAALLSLLPHALEVAGTDAHRIGATILTGLLIFFMLEKMVLWRHSHGEQLTHLVVDPAHSHAPAAGYLILLGDAIHNLVDGVLIASAFLVDVRLGIVTSIAVIAHEIPQELGDFAILLHSGFSRRKAFALNMLVSLTTVVGGVVAYFSLSFAQQLVPYVLALAAASFIYIAVADLIPGLHQRVDRRALVTQTALIIVGVFVIVGAEYLLHGQH